MMMMYRIRAKSGNPRPCYWISLFTRKVRQQQQETNFIKWNIYTNET